MSHLARRITNLFFAFVLAVMSVNLSGVLTLQNANAWTQDPNENPSTNKKSYICKMVGTPGQGEVLQTGNNPIQRDRKAGDAIGTLFNDAQGGSYVVGFGYPGEKQNKQPTLDDCIALAKPSVTVTTEPCVVGTNSTDAVKVTVKNSDGIIGNTPVYTVKIGNQTQQTAALADGASQTLTFSNLAAGTYNVTVSVYGQVAYTTTVTVKQCTEPTKVAVPVAPATVDTCNPEGVTDNVAWKNALPADTATIHWSQSPDGRTRTATLVGANVVWSDGTTAPKVFTLPADTGVHCDKPVTTVAPTKATDTCGTTNDKYTIPSVEGVSYYVNGSLVATGAGTYSTNDAASVTITAQAQPGYVLTNGSVTSWTLTFDTKACPTSVTPAAPGKNDACGIKDDTYTIPSTTGVIYQVKNAFGVYQTKAAGTYDVTLAQYLNGVEIRALPANSGYVLSGTTYWKYTFMTHMCDVPVTAPTKIDLCGTANDTYTIPESEHVKYYVNFSPVAKPAGTYTATSDVIIVAVADPGYSISTQSLWYFHFSDKACDIRVVPEAPTSVNPCGTDKDGFTIPEEHAGVIYKVNGKAVEGFNPATGSVTVTASPAAGYTFGDKEYSWTFEFDDEACEPEPCVPSVVTLPELKMLQTAQVATQDNCPPGNGGGGETPKTPKTPETPKTPPVVELPQTGANEGNAFVKIATIIAAGVMTYGAMFYIVNRRELSRK